MELHEALFSYLSGYAGLSPLVSTRIYPVIIPQSATLPAIAYERISGVREHNLVSDCGMSMPVYQFSIYSTTYNSVKAVSEQLRAALQNYSGTMGAGVTVQAVLLLSENDGFDYDSKEYFSKVDYQIFYNE